jgi:ribonucleoside-triphosphate reductase (formate)
MQKAIATFPILRKRDGRLTKFDNLKITEAIFKALYATGIDSKEKAEHLGAIVVNELTKTHAGTVPQVEEIQDIVERVLIQEGYLHTAKAYILYRAKRTSIREGKSELMDTMEDIFQETHQEFPYYFVSPGAKMMKVASAASRNFYLSRIIPSQYADAHRRGEIHIHSLEYYSKTGDSFQIPLYSLLKKGFFAGYGFIRPPKRLHSLAAQAAIVLQSCQNDMFGGQAITHFDEDMGKFIQEHLSDDEEQCAQALEGLVYNLNSMYSRVGAQVPLSTLGIGLDTSPSGRRVSKSLLTSMKNGLGKGETPLFPEIIFYVREGTNLNQGDPNYDLFRLAVEVCAKRMNPSFCFMDAQFNNAEPNRVAYWGDGSRINENRVGTPQAKGRGSIASVTINLPRIAMWISHKRSDFLLTSFYNEVQRVINLAAQQLLNRLEMLGYLKSRELPFVMGEGIYMGADSLGKDDHINAALRHGTLTIGFIGLAETLFILQGRHHGEDEGSQKLGLEIVEFMRSRVEEIAEEHHLNFVLSAPSAEKIAGKFTLLDRQEFGSIPHVTEKAYYANSFHIPPDFEISVDDRLKLDAPYHNLCNGGHATFVTARSMPAADDVEKLVRKMKEAGIGYGGISFPLDECLHCGSTIIKDERCNACGSSRIRKLRRARTHICPIEYLGKALDGERLDRVDNENM